ncbi:MAG TPA: hypothetical protein VF411_10785 [Bacteroidia bacterium]
MATDKCKYELEKYKIALDFLKFEATTLWTIFNAFFLAHAIFIGFVSTSFVEGKIQYPYLLLFSGIVGLFLAILWFRTFHSNSNWYSFRMEQAKRDEKKFVDCIKDKEWNLLTKDAEKFANSNSCLGIKNKCAGYSMITVFILIYLFIIFCSVCKISFNCCSITN